ncbi:MAG: hypothetical protein JXL97_13280 [Bacteroidales bacterium]|nr:hypothetical protein [Bacteroidales bacterium]
MRTINIKILFALVLGTLLVFNSCKKGFDEFFNDQFPETNNMSDDMFIDGELAVPILNTYFTLQNFIPSRDSSLWAEVDDDNLVHLRMFFKNIISLTTSDIYDWPIIIPVPADSTSVSSDTNKLKVYDNALSGHLFFNDPIFTFIVKNEIPVVTFFKIDTLRLHSPVFDTTYVRDDKKYYINAPLTQFSQETTEIIIDKTEIPDFETFFSPIPKFVSLYVTTGNDTPQTPLFPLVGNEKIAVDLDIDLPLDARLEDFVLGKTINFPLDTSMNVEQIENITIKMIFDNEFPVEGLTQVEFADTNNHGEIDEVIMTLFDGDGWVFESSITDPNGETTSSVRSEVTIVLSQSDVEMLVTHHASKLIITSKLNSYQSGTGQDIKIFGWYRLGIKLGFKITYTANTGNI